MSGKKAIAVASLALALAGCGAAGAAEASTVASMHRIELVDREAQAFGFVSWVLHDNGTGVQYLVVSTHRGVAVTPLLGPDGTPAMSADAGAPVALGEVAE